MQSSVEVNSDLIGLDVACSGAQIIGGLIKDISVLLDTNLIIKKNTQVNIKKSIYTEILTEFLEIFKKSTLLVDREKVKKEILEIINRDFIKGWTMRFLYSETDYSRAQYLKEQLHKADTVYFSKMDDYKQFSVCYEVSKLFVQVFKECYPKVFYQEK